MHYHRQTNETGDSTVIPKTFNHLERIAVSGTSRASNVLIDLSDVTSPTGISLLFVYDTPLVSGIILSVYNQSAVGSPVYTLTTDGIQPNARIDLMADGCGGLDLISELIPAFRS